VPISESEGPGTLSQGQPSTQAPQSRFDGQFPELAGGDLIAEAQALRQAQQAARGVEQDRRDELPIDRLVDAIAHGDVGEAMDLFKVVATPAVVLGTGVSTVLLGGALIAEGLPGGPVGAPADAAGIFFIGVGISEIDAGLAASNTILGTNIRIGPFSRATAR
jgi:hypothetical protein